MTIDEAAIEANRASLEYARTVGDNPYIVRHPRAAEVLPLGVHQKQQTFLLHDRTLELFYGGAGGGGKSQALWFGALQYVQTPGYAALILRRTYADLAKPGALMDRSKEWLTAGDGKSYLARWSEKHKRWTFPGGGSITFSYLANENDKLQYKSSEFQYIAFDELTDFSETQYTFLFTRLRKKLAGPLASVPLRMRSASNPGGPGHAWVKKRFIDAKVARPKGRVFIPAGMADNPTLDIEGYNASLAETDPMTRAQIKSGDWDAVEGGRFRSVWFPRYTWRGDMLTFKRPGEATGYSVNLWQCTRFGVIDPATSEKTKADYTVAGAWLLTPRWDLVLLDVERFQKEIPDQIPIVQAFYDRWKLHYVGIEAVAANSALNQLARRTQMITKGLSPGGTDKLVRATPAMVLAESGRIWLPDVPLRKGAPIDDCEAEWYVFTGDEKKDAHDDCVDMLSYAVQCRSGVAPAHSHGGGPMIIGAGL